MAQENLKQQFAGKNPQERVALINGIIKGKPAGWLDVLKWLADHDEHPQIREQVRKIVDQASRPASNGKVNPTQSDKTNKTIDPMQAMKSGSRQQKLEVLDLINKGMLKVDLNFLTSLIEIERDIELIASMLLAIGKLGDETQLGTINKFLKHANAQVRISAVVAVGLIGSSLGVEFVKEMLTDPDREVISHSAACLYRIDRSLALSVFEDMASSDDRVRLTSVIHALQTIDDIEFKKLLVFAEDKLNDENLNPEPEDAKDQLNVKPRGKSKKWKKTLLLVVVCVIAILVFFYMSTGRKFIFSTKGLPGLLSNKSVTNVSRNNPTQSNGQNYSDIEKNEVPSGQNQQETTLSEVSTAPTAQTASGSNHVPDYDEIKRWTDRAIPYVDAVVWIANGVSFEEAKRWAKPPIYFPAIDVCGDQASIGWREIASSPEQARAWMELGVGNAKTKNGVKRFGLSMGTVKALIHLRRGEEISASKVIELLENGFSTEDITAWANTDFPVDDWKVLRDSQVTITEAIKWSGIGVKRAKEIKRLLTSNIDISEAKKWLQTGLGIEEWIRETQSGNSPRRYVFKEKINKGIKQHTPIIVTSLKFSLMSTGFYLLALGLMYLVMYAAVWCKPKNN